MATAGVVGIGTYAPSFYRAWWGRAAQVTLVGMLMIFKTNLMMLFGAWHTRINDAKDHSIFIIFH